MPINILGKQLMGGKFMINKVESVQLYKTSLTFHDKGQSSANHGKTHTRGNSKTDVIDFSSELRGYATHKHPNEDLISMAEQLIYKQGNYSFASAREDNNINQAKHAISQDGEYGIKAISDSIVNFAIAISGNDTEKLVELKSAIEKGFAQAEKAFGGTLPEICYKTHDEIIKKLDKWGNRETSDL